MSAQWMLETHGQPLGRLHDFVEAIWQEAELDGMLVPLNGTAKGGMTPTLIRERARLHEVNPFKPLMTENAARYIPALLNDHPEQRLGAILRPCEVRALIEMSKHNGFNPEPILLVSVDCLATFDADEYAWRAERKRTGALLSDEALQFARQGGIVPYRYRSACQICYSPEAKAADLNILVLGLQARRHLLVQARDEMTAENLHLDVHTDRVAPAELQVQHERVVEKLEERRRYTRERLCANLGELLPRNVEALVDRFEACQDCQRCLEVCPICSVDFPRHDDSGRFLSQDLCRWLISCAGCGMCEQACPQDQPLCAIFGHIREQLMAETDYEPGRAFADPLPANLWPTA